MDLDRIIFRLGRYLRYWFLCLDQHSLQSPFLFQWYNDALQWPKLIRKSDEYIKNCKRTLLISKQSIYTSNYGATSTVTSNQKVAMIAKWGMTSSKYSLFLRSLIEKSSCQRVLELGTSLGINTMYLASANGVKELVSIDINNELIALASNNISDHYPNVRLICSDIDDALNDFSKQEKSFQFVYMDANHTFKATTRYFEKLKDICPTGVIVLDDINWSKEMSKAWQFIKSRPEIQLTIENYQLGIVFMGERPVAGNYTLDF